MFADKCFEQIFCTRPFPKWLLILNSLDQRFNRNRRGKSGIAVNIVCDWNLPTIAQDTSRRTTQAAFLDS